jgi:hypothetical protein
MAQDDPFADLIPDEDVSGFEDLLDDVDAQSTTKSEETLRNLSIFSGRFDPIGALETGLAAGTRIGAMAGRGLIGIAGTAAGMIPGGESPNEKANRWMNIIPEDTGYTPRTTGGATGVEMLGAGMETAVEETKKLGSPAAYAGARLAGASPEEATRSMEDFMAEPNALGEGMFRVTGSPAVATAAQLLPEIASMGIPVSRSTRVRPSSSPGIAPDMPTSGFGGIGTPPRTATRPVAAATDDVFTELRNAIRRGDKERVMELINANPAIVAAFDELGIDFTPGMVSESMPIRQTEAALGSMADSSIPTLHKGVQSELAERARRLIDESGGDFDSPTTIGENISARMDELHRNYLREEDLIWDQLNRQIPKGQEIDVSNIAQQLEATAERLGKGDLDLGISRMSKHERELWNLTHQRVRRKVKNQDGKDKIIEEWEYDAPPWEAIDRYRRRLGLGLNRQGPFNDAEIGELKNWYGQVAEQQTRFARGNQYEANWERMNALTQERKALEDAMRRTAGVGSFNQSVLTKLKSATNSLIRDGDPKKWDQFMDDLPADQQQAAAAQSLQFILFPAGKGTRMSESVVANFDKIKRNPQILDRLLDPLPTEARSQFMAIGEAVTGFYRMMDRALSNPSGTGGTQYVLNKIGEPEFMNRVMGFVVERGTGRLPVIGEWAKTLTRRTTEQQKAAQANRLQAAANMLSDPALHRAIVEYANGRIEAANKILRDSQTWAEWAKTQPIPFQRQLQASGIAALIGEVEGGVNAMLQPELVEGP